ncbi:MAG: methyltransferase [Acidimicrobiales bacterium]|nr:methyltransferase [Acidimicrobiales bacterium]
MTDAAPPTGLACYLCGGTALDLVRTKVRHADRDVYLCQTCGLDFLAPNERDLREYYATDYRNEFGHAVGEPANSQQIFDVYEPFQAPRIELLKSYLPTDGRMLDIGASAGHFLAACAPHVAERVAVELNLDNAQFIRDTQGIDAYTTPVEETDLPKEHFDLITCFQTMEHIPDPRNFLQQVREYLKPDGWLYVEVPNLDDALLSVHGVGEYADFWYREPHLYNFSPATLTQLMDQAGFTGEILPVQRYGLLNHMNWLLARQPQPSAGVAMGEPALVPTAKSDADTELNAWFSRVDQEYRELLRKHVVSESIGFIGKKS